ncbi:hypothetical protein BDW59DRAFT_108874 [Aspergillus cavernicola]|uniref:Uncharacterized protein n=1 Tax=Aspergillus cavernicola TaxID=176166 RepID=A0ABR4I1W9_9EURO
MARDRILLSQEAHRQDQRGSVAANHSGPMATRPKVDGSTTSTSAAKAVKLTAQRQKDNKKNRPQQIELTDCPKSWAIAFAAKCRRCQYRPELQIVRWAFYPKIFSFSNLYPFLNSSP